MLGSLQNCSLIEQGSNSGGVQCYYVHENVQMMVRKWVLVNMGLKTLLELHRTTLCMLLSC
jgi:hypothetical protein